MGKHEKEAPKAVATGKRRWFPAAFGAILTVAFALALLDTFVFEHAREMPDGDLGEPTEIVLDGTGALEGLTVEGEQTSVTMRNFRWKDSDIHVADIYLAGAKNLQTAFAKDKYGFGVAEPVSVMAKRHSAVVAINGDYYGAKRTGYVIRNGVLYSDVPSAAVEKRPDLVIFTDGSYEILEDESSVSAAELMERGAWQLLSFGPVLVKDHQVNVSMDAYLYPHEWYKNPRTAIGVIDGLHYVFVVCDGRDGSKNAGLKAVEFAEFLRLIGCEMAYNLDGGGSSVMVYGGEWASNPTGVGDSLYERAVSDCVYVTTGATPAAE